MDASDELDKARARIRARRQAAAAVFVGTTAVVLPVVVFLLDPSRSVSIPLPALVSLGAVAASLLVALKFAGDDTEKSSAHARQALDQAVENVSSPNDLLKLMEVNRRQMEAYDVQARAQGRTSHWSSLLAMTAGLGIVGVGWWIAVTAGDTATKYAAAIVAAVGTATGGYIARTFIQVNTAAQQHVRYYFEQPLVQSYLLTAERVIERLPEDERGQQYALVVAAALAQAGMVPQMRNPIPETGQFDQAQPEAVPATDPPAAEGASQ